MKVPIINVSKYTIVRNVIKLLEVSRVRTFTTNLKLSSIYKKIIEIESKSSLELNLQVKKEPSENDAVIAQVRKENYHLECVIADQKEEIKGIEVSNTVQKDINDKLHKEIEKSKIRVKKEIDLMKENHRDEIKSARNDLGEEVKEKIRLLEEKLRKAKTDCDKPPLPSSYSAFSTTTCNPRALLNVSIH